LSPEFHWFSASARNVLKPQSFRGAASRARIASYMALKLLSQEVYTSALRQNEGDGTWRRGM
jgi:hypothetical protein